MADANDMDLMREFARHNSETAFAGLVQRHINLVYSVALRFTDNTGDAQDVTQAVFIILARKAAGLPARTVLTGWLYETTRFTAIRLLRTQTRRRIHEQEATMQSTLSESGTDPLWAQLAPHLEAAMSRLAEQDRTLLALRFYENKTGAQAAAQLGIREEAAHKRTARALEKLRIFFHKRGIDSTAATIAEQISAHSVQAAPVALAKTISAVALAKGAAASTSTLTLVKGALKIMAWTKMKTAVVVGVSVLLAAGTTTVAVKVIRERPIVVQGKTESEWIKSIVYNGDDNQRKLWHSLGPNGIKMLVRAMKPPPDGLTEEQASASRKTRMCAADLLCQLGDYKEDTIAVPDVIKLLKTEKDDSVRGLELGYFEMPIQSMSDKDKAALLLELIRSLGRNHSSERNNALVALQYYTNQKETVVPLMVNALQDSNPQVRLMAVKALEKIDPQNSASSNFVPVLAGCVTGPPGDTPGAANDAVLMLGQLHREPDVAVPVLIQALQSSEWYVRNNAASALGKFGAQAKSAIPALTKALEDSDDRVRRQAAAALKNINSGAPPPK